MTVKMESVKTLSKDRQRATTVSAECPGDLCIPTESVCREATVNVILALSRVSFGMCLNVNIYIYLLCSIQHFGFTKTFLFNFYICLVFAKPGKFQNQRIHADSEIKLK